MTDPVSVPALLKRIEKWQEDNPAWIVGASSFAGVAREVSRLRQELEVARLLITTLEAEVHEGVEQELNLNDELRKAEAEGRALAEARDQLVASADAIRAECLKAGMQEPSTLLDYIRTVFYAYQRDVAKLKAAETALRDALHAYGEHQAPCQIQPCTCGLAAVRGPQTPDGETHA